MAQNVQVLVKSKDSKSESIITYRAFLELQASLDLVGQVDEDGNLIPGDPNLQPRHRKGASVNVTVSDEGKVPEWLVQKGLTEMHDKFGEKVLQELATDNNPPEPTPGAQAPDTFHVEHEETIEESEGDNSSPGVPVEEGSTQSEPLQERRKPGRPPKNK